MPYSIPDLISWGKISQPLARAYQIKHRGTIGDTTVTDLDIALYVTRRDVEYEFDQDPTSDNLYSIGNYFYALMGIFALEAMDISGSGGTLSPLSFDCSVPDDLDFIVSASTIIPTGGSQVYLNGQGGRPDFRGYNVDFARNGTTQYTTVQLGGANYYSWNKLTGLFTLLPFSTGIALVDESFRIMPDTGGCSGSSSTPATRYPIVVNAANFEVDGVTLNLSSIVGDYVMLFVSGYSSEWQFSGTFFDYTATGLVITQAGFDANNFGNIIIQQIF